MLFTDVKVVLSTELNSVNIDVSLNIHSKICLLFVAISTGCYPTT